MARRVSMSTRTELVAAIRERYQRSNRTGRTAILDEFVAVTGYHRKHAVRLLTSAAERQLSSARAVARRYGVEVREALIVLWEASDRICSKRLKPLIPTLLPALKRHARLTLTAELRALLLAVSPASMDRLLSEVRLVARAGVDDVPVSSRQCGVRFRCALLATGTTRRQALSRSISSRMAAPRPPAALYRRWS